MTVEPGSIVVAPLGPRQLIGVVWEPERLPAEEVGDNRLRPLLHAYDLPPLAAPLRRLIEWTADYYLAPLGGGAAHGPALVGRARGRAHVTEYRATGHRARAADAAARAGAGADRRAPWAWSASWRSSAASPTASIRGLVKAGAIEAVEVAIDDPFPVPDPGP